MDQHASTIKLRAIPHLALRRRSRYKYVLYCCQTLMLSVGSKTPQLSIELSTSDEYTPGSVIQLQEIIGLNVSVTLPEVSATMSVLMWSNVCCCMIMLVTLQGLTSSLTVELSQVGMLSPNYTVSVTRGEILHIGESIINLTSSEGDTLSNSSAVTITELVCFVH